MRKAALALALLAVLAPVAVAPSAAAPTGDAPQLQVDDGGAVGTTMAVQLRSDTHAEWTVTSGHRLDTENETAAFREFADRWADNETDRGLGVETFRTLADQSSAATGRSMAITDVERTTDVNGSVGTLTLRFTWTNFLTERGDELRLGDAFRLPDNGTWLRMLESDQRLVIEAPSEYSLETSTYPIENNSLVFDGPVSLDRQPEARYDRITVATTPPVQQGTPWELIVGGIVVAALIVAAALLVAFRGRDREPDDEPEPVGGGRPDDGAAAPTAEEPSTEPAEEDLSLLSDEERVERLLERNDGRMKQATIVNETGWSDAKVSQLLSSMADAERVEKLRLGRENLISLPEEAESVDDERP
jgi:uncharacterized membrane protein